MALDGVEAIIFDVFGTVVDCDSSVTAELVALGKQYGLNESEGDWIKFVKSWRKGYDDYTFKHAEDGQGTTNVDELHRQLLDDLLATPRWTDFGKLLSDEARRELNLAWHRLKGWPDTVEGLYRIKKEVIIASLSNGNVRLLVDMAKFSDLPWDAVFSSDLFGRYKPAPEPYLGALKHLSLSSAPEKLAMVAAHLDDLNAAASHGIKTIYIDRGDDEPDVDPKGIKPKSEGGTVDAVISSFGELADILARRHH